MNDSDNNENDLLNGETVEVHADAWDEEDMPLAHANPFTVQHPESVTQAIHNGLRAMNVRNDSAPTAPAEPSTSSSAGPSSARYPPLPEYDEG